MHCDELKVFLSSRNLRMPKSGDTIWKLIKKFYDAKFEQQKEKTKKKRDNGVKFSLCVDEWTDIVSKEFLSVCLHDDEETFNLGLVAISA